MGGQNFCFIYQEMAIVLVKFLHKYDHVVSYCNPVGPIFMSLFMKLYFNHFFLVRLSRKIYPYKTLTFQYRLLLELHAPSAKDICKC